MMSRIVRHIILGGLLFIAACSTVPHAEYAPSLAMPEDAHPSPIMFSRLGMQLSPGDKVGSISAGACWWPVETSRIVLRKAIDQIDIDHMFEETMEGDGYDVVGSLNLFFDEEVEDEEARTEYKVGGKIIHAEIDSCYTQPELLLGQPFGTEGVRGEILLTIEWSVYDALRRRTVYRTTTNGYAKLRQEHPEGLTVLISDAFSMAAHNLGADQKFFDLIVSGVKPEGFPPHEKHEDRPRVFDPREEVRVHNKQLSQQSIEGKADPVLEAAVLIEGGDGRHGSGFFITEQGHILTNNHVAGDALRIRVASKGYKKKMIAEVLRRDPVRDVSLLKLEEIPEGYSIHTLPIRTEWPAVSEVIYAIGAPQLRKFQDTITRGIVSAHRKNYRVFGTTVDLIQGDVSIHGGNSGGPIVDANGNIVAMSVAGFGAGDGFNASLNFFIPIEQALKSVDVGLE